MTVGARIEALVDKADFLTLPEVAHLCAGGETPILRSHGEAVARFFDLKSRGMAGREQGVMGLLATCRQRAGNLLGVPADDIAFLSSASEGINQLASWLDWQPGDNVVVEDIEFPSGIYPWVRLRERGVEVRVVRQSGDTPTLERIAASMDDRTRILATSQVSYLTGRRYDLADLAALARRHGSLLSVDATHAAGVVPVAARHADILVSSCYKFLLSVHGAAIFYRNPARLADLEPLTVGWHSIGSQHTVAAPTDYTLASAAARFEAGNPPFMAVAVLENALRYLDAIGIERIERHVLALGDLLWHSLRDRGFELLTPEDAANRGPNVCFAWDDTAGLVAALAARDVLIWGGDGRIRISLHAYNDQDDIERLLAGLDAIRSGQ
jgi:cysteine desulfurase / selenocysteine lyase